MRLLSFCVSTCDIWLLSERVTVPSLLATIKILAEFRHLENAIIMVESWVLYWYISIDIFGNSCKLCAHNLKISSISKHFSILCRCCRSQTNAVNDFSFFWESSCCTWLLWNPVNEVALYEINNCLSSLVSSGYVRHWDFGVAASELLAYPKYFHPL